MLIEVPKKTMAKMNNGLTIGFFLLLKSVR